MIQNNFKTLLQVALSLDGIKLDDLTKAEHRIFEALRDAGIMEAKKTRTETYLAITKEAENA